MKVPVGSPMVKKISPSMRDSNTQRHLLDSFNDRESSQATPKEKPDLTIG